MNIIKPMLHKKSQKIIQDFLHLPFDNHDIPCPYFNNRKIGSRGTLRVLVGKGNPDEIVEEAQLIALREKIDIKTLSNDELTTFLVEKNLGIDCSALAYYILDAESKKPLKKILTFPHTKNPLRKLLIKLRPIENTGVKTLAHEQNSREITLSDIQIGDMIIMMHGGPRKDYNHILIITNLTSDTITYIHAFRWPSDGAYHHGVREGTIQIIDIHTSLLEQTWIEQQKTGEENWTYMHAKSAESVQIRRLKKNI